MADPRSLLSAIDRLSLLCIDAFDRAYDHSRGIEDDPTAAARYNRFAACYNAVSELVPRQVFLERKTFTSSA